MPIFVKDFTWQQSDQYITIHVPLKNVHEKEVDLLTWNKYVKANYYPYMFELFLSNPVDHKSSKCYIKDENIIFELCKCDFGVHWNELEEPLTKPEKMELKKQYMEEIEKYTKETCEKQSTQRREMKRHAVRSQIEVDTQFRQKMDTIKKEEEEKALKELQLFENRAPIDKDKLLAIEPPPEPKLKPTKNKTKRLPSPPKVMNIPKPIPLPRTRQTVNVTFTPRQFPTPSRESKSQEEEEWLAKQAEARRISGFDDGDLRPEERDPQWLKNKGDEFFKVKNYIAAISAYTTGIKISPNFVPLYVNRSAAQFAAKNYCKVVDDCSTALDKMKPICEANRVLRAKCIARRGAALCQLGLWREGRGELEAAIKLVPDDETLKQDLKKINLKLEPTSEIITT